MSAAKYEIEHSKGRIFHSARVISYKGQSPHFGPYKLFIRFSKEKAIAAAKRWCDKHHESQYAYIIEYSPVVEDLPETEEEEAKDQSPPPFQWYK